MTGISNAMRAALSLTSLNAHATTPMVADAPDTGGQHMQMDALDPK